MLFNDHQDAASVSLGTHPSYSSIVTQVVHLVPADNEIELNTVCVPSGYGDKTLSVKLFFLLVKYLCADVQATRCDESIFLSAKSCVYEIMLWLLSCQSIQRLKDELIFLIFR